MRKSMLVAVLLGTALAISSTTAFAAKKTDPAVAANRDSARLVHDATDPYCATSKNCHRHHHHWGWGWHHRHHHNDWGWGWGWNRHHHDDWGWGSGWGWHEHHHHHHAHHHHHHHKKAM